MKKNLVILVFSALTFIFLSSCASDPERIAKGSAITLKANQDVAERQQVQEQKNEIFQIKKQTVTVKEASRQAFIPKLYTAYADVVLAAKVAVILVLLSVAGSAAFVFASVCYSFGMTRVKEIPNNVTYTGHGKFAVSLNGEKQLLDTRNQNQRELVSLFIGSENNSKSKKEQQGDMTIE